MQAVAVPVAEPALHRRRCRRFTVAHHATGVSVVDVAGALRGVLTREALIAALRDSGGATPVIDIMDREVPTVPENACLDNIFQMLQRSRARVIAVVDPRGKLVGYITAENLTELVMIQSSRSARAEQAASASGRA